SPASSRSLPPAVAARWLTSGTTAAGGRGAEEWSPSPCRHLGRRRRPGGRGEGGLPRMPSRPATTLCAPCALGRPVSLAPPVRICDGWRVGEVPERPKGHAWRACVPTRYRGFESLPLRFTLHPHGNVDTVAPAPRASGGGG